MKSLKHYIYPHLILSSLKDAILDIKHLKKYESILDELDASEKLSKMGFRRNGNKLYLGVNLNPELLMYTEDSQESVELKFVSESMKRYTNFLQNEGILDSIQAEYDRVYTDDFYGYVVQISYNKKYDPKKMKYDIIYSVITSSMIIISIIMLIKTLL